MIPVVYHAHPVKIVTNKAGNKKVRHRFVRIRYVDNLTSSSPEVFNEPLSFFVLGPAATSIAERKTRLDP